MNRDKWWVIAIRGPLHVLEYLLHPLYDISFGMLDKHLARKNEHRLSVDIQSALRFLFTDYEGRIVPNSGIAFPPRFDYSFVTIAIKSMLLRFSRGRGQVGVFIAPEFAPEDWHDLSLVLAVIQGLPSLNRERYDNLWHIAKSLEPNIQALIENCTVQRFARIKDRLQIEIYAPESFLNRQWATQTNARLYGPK